MPDDIPFLDIVGDDSQRLLGEPLKPQDASLEIMRRFAHREPHTDDLRLFRWSRELGQRAIDMMARASCWSPEVMRRRGEEAIGHHQIGRIYRFAPPASKACCSSLR